jgi:bacterioferritin-associated ferredoxin
VLSCPTVKRMFVDYFDEGLPGEYRELIEEHLGVCSQCCSCAESYRAVIHLTRQLPPMPAPPELLDSLRQSAEELGLIAPENE